MHNDEIIQATPTILEEVISSPQVLFSAEAYFLALSDLYDESTHDSTYRKQVKIDLLSGKLQERIMWAAKKAFHDYWQNAYAKIPAPMEQEPSPDAPFLLDRAVAQGKLTSITRTEGGFNIHLGVDVEDMVFYVSKANCLVDKLLFLLNKDVVVEYDASVKSPSGVIQAYTISLFRPPT